MKAKERISDLVDSLMAEGQTILGTEFKRSGNWVGSAPRYIDLQQFTKWRASCNLLVSLMGDIADPWRDVLAGDTANQSVTAISMLGTLQAGNYGVAS